MSKLAEAIAKFEGFGKPGTIPTVRNNPGDLRHAPHLSHDGLHPDDIGIAQTVADGWADLERQLRLYASRGMTLQQAISAFAPSNENDTSRYLAFVCTQLGCTADCPVSQLLA